MPIIKCLGCNRDTNTALCDWIDCKKNVKKIEFADKCYAAWDYEKQEWVQGCAKSIPLVQANMLRDIVKRQKEEAKIGKKAYAKKQLKNALNKEDYNG